LKKQENGVGDLLFVHGHDVVYIFLNQGQSLFPRTSHGNAVGNSRSWAQRNRMAFGDCHLHRGRSRRLHTDHFHSRVSLLYRASYPGDKTPTTNGSDDGLYLRDLLEDLESHSALSGNHGQVVKGVYKGHAQPPTAAHRLLACLVIIGTVKYDFR